MNKWKSFLDQKPVPKKICAVKKLRDIGQNASRIYIGHFNQMKDHFPERFDPDFWRWIESGYISPRTGVVIEKSKDMMVDHEDLLWIYLDEAFN